MNLYDLFMQHMGAQQRADLAWQALTDVLPNGQLYVLQARNETAPKDGEILHAGTLRACIDAIEANPDWALQMGDGNYAVDKDMREVARIYTVIRGSGGNQARFMGAMAWLKADGEKPKQMSPDVKSPEEILEQISRNWSYSWAQAATGNDYEYDATLDYFRKLLLRYGHSLSDVESTVLLDAALKRAVRER